MLAISNDPAAVRADLWHRFAAALRDRHSTFHTPTLTSVDGDGVPVSRTVVLRIAEAESGTIGCHSRADAGKIKQLLERPLVTWHVYDRAAKLQVVLTGKASVHQRSALADERWDATSHGSRKCYRLTDGPGTPRHEFDVPAESGDGRDRFAVITAEILQIDWLWLHHQGHRRWLLKKGIKRWRSDRVSA